MTLFAWWPSPWLAQVAGQRRGPNLRPSNEWQHFRKSGERKARDGANELYEINLAEVGPTLKGMNPDTELHAVKSAVAIADPNRPTADELRRQCDRLAAELLIEGLGTPHQPERHVPTIADLNSQCRELGLPTFREHDPYADERADIQRTLVRAWFGR
jgi:hypothetical protein